MERAAEAVTTNEMEAQIIDRKGEALAEFVRRLRASPAADRIAQIVLYGSYARGEAGPESDVDVLILTAGPIEEVQRTTDGIAGDLMLEFLERIEPMVYSVGEAIAPSPFVYRVLRESREVYRMDAETLRREESRSLYELAQMYLEAARKRYDPADEGSRRLTADGAYNAVELTAKAFLRTKDQQLPKTHDGVSRRFSELFVLPGLVPRAFGGRFTTALRLRNRARYDRHASIEDTQAQETLNFAEAMLKAWEAYLSGAAKPQEETNPSE